MYDAIDDPYTYANSTVLVNKLDLRDQDELDADEAEISNARSGEPLPEGELDFVHYCAVNLLTFKQGVDAFRATNRISDSDKVKLMGANTARLYGWLPPKS